MYKIYIRQQIRRDENTHIYYACKGATPNFFHLKGLLKGEDRGFWQYYHKLKNLLDLSLG